MPDFHYGEEMQYIAGDIGISKWTVTGTSPAGQKIRANGCDFYTLRDGLVVNEDTYWKIVEE
jgi:ketosteroid isomerase-like protein